MTLDQVLQLIENSVETNWQKLERATVYGWVYGQVNGQKYLEPKTHSKLLIYKDDIDISLAMDATVTDPFDEPWVHRFPDTHAVSVAVELRFRGAIVYSWVFVLVDGARYLLPMPSPIGGGVYQVSLAAMPLARLLFRLYGTFGVHQELDAALAHANIAVV